MNDDRLLADFVGKVMDILEKHAKDKGYASGGLAGPDPLFEVTGPDHAMGEAIMKAVRYRKKHDPDDLIKGAAWFYLAWRHHTAREHDAAR